MTRFANPRKAYGVCDQCGLYGPRLVRLVWDGDNETQTSRVHRECADKLNPSIVLGRRKYNDGLALRDPRPRYVSVPNPTIWDGGLTIWDGGLTIWDYTVGQTEVAS